MIISLIRNFSTPLVKEGEKFVHDPCQVYDRDYWQLSNSTYQQALSQVQDLNSTASTCNEWVFETEKNMRLTIVNQVKK